MDLEPGWMLRLEESGTLLALLILGHVVADFVAQTDEMVKRKAKARVLVWHGILVALIQFAVMGVYATLASVVIIVPLAVGHVLVDAAKIRIQAKTRLKATVFLADQACHLVLLVLAWHAMTTLGWWTPRSFPLGHDTITSGAILLAGYAFAWNGGGSIVRELLLSRGASRVDTPNQMGKLIGCLERWIVITLVLLSQWAAIAFIFAAKSIARFKQIEKRPFAEYYLVGTLASLVVGASIGLATAWMLRF